MRRATDWSTRRNTKSTTWGDTEAPGRKSNRCDTAVESGKDRMGAATWNRWDGKRKRNGWTDGRSVVSGRVETCRNVPAGHVFGLRQRPNASGDGGESWTAWPELAAKLGLAVAALGAVATAWFNGNATLRTLWNKQYEVAASQLRGAGQSGGWSYVTRTAAIATLAKLAKDHPADYDEPVMRTFEAFLSFPPRYDRNAAKEGQVDYTSRDTEAVVQTINKRSQEQRCTYRIELPPDRPFRVTQDGGVEKNPEYEDPYG